MEAQQREEEERRRKEEEERARAEAVRKVKIPFTCRYLMVLGRGSGV